MPLVPVDYDPFATENSGDPEAAGAGAASIAMQPAVSSYIANTPERVLSPFQGHYDPSRTIAQNALDPASLDTAMGLGMGFSGGGLGIKAFHGSPYDFNAFDINKVGTGEGAQIYGHGLYFAENPEVAEQYRANVIDMPKLNALNQRMSQIANEMEPLRKPGTYRDFSDPRGNELADEYDRLMAEKMQPGNVYEVGITAHPDSFLNWDTPFSQQSPDVQDAIKNALRPTPDAMDYWRNRLQDDFSENGKLGYPQHRFDAVMDEAISHGGYGEHFGNRVWDELREAAPQTADEFRYFLDTHGVGLGVEDTGAQAYRMIANKLSNDAAASQALRDAGIPGVKYLDQGSRATGEGTNNYVVFDDKLINILRKYRLAGLISGGAYTLGGNANAAVHAIPVEHDPFSADSNGVPPLPY